MSANHLLEMKKQVESILKIEVWNPTEEQLINIWDELAKLPDNADENKILQVVNSIYGEPLIVSCMEGLDTSRALMSLFKIKEMQGNIKQVNNNNSNTKIKKT